MDLTELHALCEANYVRLLRLFPDYQQANDRRFKLGSRLIVMTVIERDRHTTTLSIDYHATDLPELMHSNLHLRMYHDVAMAEVVKLRSGVDWSRDTTTPIPTCTNRTKSVSRICLWRSC